MPSKTSWFRKEIIKQDLRNVGWIGVVYFAVLLFAIPLEILLRVTSERQQYYYYDEMSVFHFHPEIQILSIFTVPVLLAIFMFRYMQVKQSSDFIHSLPIKRVSIFHYHLITGLALMIVPILIIALILLFMSAGMDLSEYFITSDLVYWLGVTIVVITTIFLTGILVGIITGISAVQGLLTYVLLLFPAGITVLVFVNLDYMLIGFSENYYLTSRVVEFSPITDLIEIYHHDFTLIKGLIYSCVSVLFYILSVQLYKKRKLEAVTQALVFSQLRPVFKYGVTFCMTLLGGFYFGETQNQFYWIVFGYLLGAIIGYLIAEMLLQKTWRVFGNWKGFIGFVVAVVVLYFIVAADLTGYENKIPKADTIERIYFNQPVDAESYANEINQFQFPKYLETDENIAAVRDLHQQLIEQSRRMENGSSYYVDRISIGYMLKSGKTLMREYYVQDLNTINEYLKPIYQSKEYKETVNEVLHVNGDEIAKIELLSETPTMTSETAIVEPEQINSFMEALKNDVYNETFDEINSPRHHMSTIRILTDDEYVMHIQYKQGYKELTDWLKEKELFDDVTISADNISKVVVVNIQEKYPNDLIDLMNKASENDDKVMIIKDKVQITEILSGTGYGKEDSGYVIGYFFDNEDYPSVQHFASGYVPDFITNYFNR